MSKLLLIADAEAQTLSLVDAGQMAPVAQFAAHGRVAVLGASASRRYAFAVHRDDHAVSVFDAAARSFRIVPTGQQPTHFHAHDGQVVIFNDGSGSVSIFAENDIYAPLTVPATQPDHGSAVVLGGYLLAGHLRAGVVDVYPLGESERILRFDDCPVLHGAAQVGESALFGCGDGVMVIRRDGDTFTGIKQPNPPDTPPRVRVGLFATHPASKYALGNFGLGLALIDPLADHFDVLPLPGHPIQFAFDPTGTGVLVLTADGTLHRLALPGGEITASASVTAPVDPPKGPDGKPRPALAVADSFAYVVSPDDAAVSEISLDTLTVTRKITLEGKPRSVVYLG